MGGEDQLQRVDLAGLVHGAHPQPEVDDVLFELGFLDGELALGLRHLGRDRLQRRGLALDLLSATGPGWR